MNATDYTEKRYVILRQTIIAPPQMFWPQQKFHSHAELQYVLRERWVNLKTVVVFDCRFAKVIPAVDWLTLHPAPKCTRGNKTYFAPGFNGNAEEFWKHYDAAESNYPNYHVF